MNKLGGWWRLWIVLTCFYAAGMGLFFYSLWPSASNVTHGPWLTYRLSAASQAYISKEPTEEELSAQLLRAHADGKTAEAKVLARQIEDLRAGWSFTKVTPVVVEGGHTFHLRDDTPPERIEAFKADYQRVVAEEVRRQQARSARDLAVVVGVPSLLLLALGLAVAWIRRGFRQRPA